MIPIPYLKEALAGACAILFITCVIMGVMLKTANMRLSANAETITALEQQLETADSTIVELQTTIVYQNQAIKDAERAGYEAQAAQIQIDELSATVVNLKALLSKSQSENIALRERAANLSICETYELVLRSIAGVLQ